MHDGKEKVWKEKVPICIRLVKQKYHKKVKIGDVTLSITRNNDIKGNLGYGKGI